MSADYRLSDEQQAAVDSTSRAICVVASAGSGKTEVVARRVERLLNESEDEGFRVLALSYTVKAAAELTTRFRSRLGGRQKRVEASTIHGFAHSLLRQHGTRIGLPLEPEVLSRDADRAEMFARWLHDEGRPVPTDIDGALRAVDLSRAQEVTTTESTQWETALAAAGALDYQSMLTRTQELLSLPSARRQLARLYDHVIVDEAQNLTRSQYSLLTALVGEASSTDHLHTMVVGDDKQSIVGFAGADHTLIRRFEKEYNADRFELTVNFRSAAKIVELSDAVSEALGQHLPDGRQHQYAATGSVKEVAAADERQEGQLVSDWALRMIADGLPEVALADGEPVDVVPRDVAILARSAASLRPTELALRQAGHEPSVSSSPEDWLASRLARVAFESANLLSAPHHQSARWELLRLLSIPEHELARPDELRDVLLGHHDLNVAAVGQLLQIEDPIAYLESIAGMALHEDTSDEALAAWSADTMLLTETWREFAAETAASAQNWANFRVFVARAQRGDDSSPGIRLQTIHKAQGREYRAVALIGLSDGQLPDFRASSEEDLRAELRAFYVAISRPTRVLLLSRAGQRLTRYGPRDTDRSPFLDYASALSD